MKNEKHKVSSLVKRVCLVLSLLTPGSSMMVIASDEIAIVQQTGNITVTGTVVDQTGEPVIGVNVLVKGSCGRLHHGRRPPESRIDRRSGIRYRQPGVRTRMGQRHDE